MSARGKLLRRAVLAALVAVGVSIGAVAYALRKESAAFSKCHGNLAAISLALANYHSAFDTFPCGAVSNPDLPPHKRLSWLTAILNFLEGGLQLQIDTTQAWDAAANRTPLFLHTSTTGEPPPYTTRAVDLELLRCPARITDPAGAEPVHPITWESPDWGATRPRCR